MKREVEKRLAERKQRARPPAGARAIGSSAGADEPPAAEETKPRRVAAEPARGDSPFISDAPVELAPPAQATATARGVVLSTREGDVVVSRLGHLPQGASAKTPLEALPNSGGH